MKKNALLLFLSLFIGCEFVGAQYYVMHNFNGTGGACPYGDLVLCGSKLYGLTSKGGVNHLGCIFSIDTNGTGFKDLHDFNGINGANPGGSLILSVTRDTLYGMTEMGGAYNCGCIFSIDTGGKGYAEVLNFGASSGAHPAGSLTLSGKMFYGLTSGGGAYNEGVIFSVKTNGSGYTDMYDFLDAHYANPNGSLIIAGNVLYGMTLWGGSNHEGSIFSIHTNGSGYIDLRDFNGTDGGYSYGGALAILGNKLYGMTHFGGIYGTGNIFSIDTNGNNFKDLMDFNVTNGQYPCGSLTVEGNRLYGMTYVGGGLGLGNVFIINTNGSSFTDLHDFNMAAGSKPYGSLIYSQGIWYGMTEWGGSSDSGVIFKLNKCAINEFSEPVCMLTVDTATNKCELIWGRTNSPPQNGFGSYNIYRDTGTGLVLVHSQALNVLSEYLDLTSDPSANSESYELSTDDSCGESDHSSSLATMHLTTTAGFNVYKLNWTPYVGFTPSKYRIFRGLTMHSMVQIDSVSNTTLTFNDTLPPIGSYYAIEAVNPAGACIPTAKIKGHNTLATLSGSFSNGFNTGNILTGMAAYNSLISLTIYPNPSNGSVTLQSLELSGPWAVNIYNELGQQVFTKTGTGILNEKINTESFASGIYSVRVQTSAGNSVKKLVLIRK